MITATKEIQVQNNTIEAIEWLKKEYSRGIDLVYVDYSDAYEDMATLQDVLKTGGDENQDWQFDMQHETILEVIKNYQEEIKADELSEEVQEAMREWLFEHDVSNPTKQLLKNTGNKLFYIDTVDYSEEDKKNWKKLKVKYGKTEEQKKEIDYVINEQFYGAPISFYFYANPFDVFDAIHNNNNKYIVINKAYFSTIDRVQGSNWLGEKAIFKIVIPKDNFIENFFVDRAKGTGYGWYDMSGQSDYAEASIFVSKTKSKDAILIKTETTEAQKREKLLQDNWDKTHKCMRGDMNWNRHVGDKPYKNEYPCGNTCETCGTFWID